MPAPLSGPGVGLALPQQLYPTALTNAPLDQPSNRLALAPGDAIPIPAGDWYISLGMYLVLQFLDPITNTWSMGASGGWESGVIFVKSDGFNCRVANLTGCPVGAVVVQYGGNQTQATTSIASNIGGSTWLPIIGGQLQIAGTIGTLCGGGYGAPPLVLIPPPPSAANNSNGVGGIPASAYAVIASGTVSTISFTNPGAGYSGTGFTLVLQPSPYDPNLATGLTAATISMTVVGASSLTGVLCTNSGNALAANQIASLTLTVSGGTGATVAPNILQTLLTSTVSGSGAGSGTFIGATSGGAPSQGTVTNSPDFLRLGFKPRPAQFTYPSIAAGAAATIIDGGLFMTPPTAYVVGTGTVTTVATLANTTGGTPDIAVMQPAP